MQSKKPERKPCEISHLHLVLDADMVADADNEAGSNAELKEELVESAELRTELVSAELSEDSANDKPQELFGGSSRDSASLTEQQELFGGSASSQDSEITESQSSVAEVTKQESVEGEESAKDSERQEAVEMAQTTKGRTKLEAEEASETTTHAETNKAPEPSPLAGSYRRNGKLDHAQILGDPFASEKTWMAAHIASDSKCKPASPPLINRVILAFLTATGVCWSAMTLWLATLLGLFFVDNAQAWSLGSLDLYQFGSLNGTIAVAFFCSFISGLALWSAFLLNPGRIKKTVNVLLGTATTLMVSILCFCVGWISAPVLLVMFLASVMGCYFLGSTCRASLPKSQSLGRLLRGNALTLLLPASFFIATVCGVVQSLREHPLASPSMPSGAPEQIFGMALTQVAFAFCILAPGFGMALFAKSKSAAASVLMSVVTQAPIIFGFLIATAFSVIAATGLDHSIIPEIAGFTVNGGDWARFGWVRTALLLGMTLWTILLSVAGGWLGAKLVRK